MNMNFFPSKDGLSPEAWQQHTNTVRELCARFDKVNILEIGGGRSPSFALDDLPPNVESYTVNDIDAAELARVPSGYRTACFDACGDVSQFAGQYDLVFSKMLAEHVPDGERFHINVLSLLKNGGIAFHFFPKLYPVPFLVNHLLPESTSYKILTFFFPHRRKQTPKFPALYSWCSGTAGAIEKRIKGVGYSKVEVVPFYGHTYYTKLPGLRELEQWFRRAARKAKFSLVATYVYVFAQR